MKKKKVLIITPYYYPEGTAAAHRITMLSNTISKYYQTNILVYNNIVPPFDLYRRGIKFIYWRNFLNIKRFYKFPYDILKLLFHVFLYRYRWIIISTPEHIPSFVSALILTPFFRIIIDFRDTTLERISYLKKGGFRYIITKISLMLEKFLFRKKNLIVVTATESMKELMIKYHNHVRTTYTLRNGVDPDMIVKDRAIKPIYDIVFLGFLAKYRLPEKLFEILYLVKKKKKDMKALLIIGDIEKYKKLGFDINSLVERYKLKENIKILPFIPWDKLKYILPLAKLGYIAFMDNPSFYIAVGYKVYDYIAAGLPIISYADATKFKELSKIIGKGGIFVTKIEEVAESIVRILNDKNLYNNLKKEIEKKREVLTFPSQAETFVKKVLFSFDKII